MKPFHRRNHRDVHGSLSNRRNPTQNITAVNATIIATVNHENSETRFTVMMSADGNAVLMPETILSPTVAKSRHSVTAGRPESQKMPLPVTTNANRAATATKRRVDNGTAVKIEKCQAPIAAIKTALKAAASPATSDRRMILDMPTPSERRCNLNATSDGVRAGVQYPRRGIKQIRVARMAGANFL